MTPFLNSNLATNTRRAMARLGLTQEEVAQRSGVDGRTLRSVLYGRARAHAMTVRKLATGLGVSEEALVADPRLLTRRGTTVRDELEGYIVEKPWLFARMPAEELDELVELVEAIKLRAAG